MTVRRRRLPPGWYPGSTGAIEAKIAEFTASSAQTPGDVLAGLAPHAGWEFSGPLACAVIRALPRDSQTVVVVGGHLGPGDGVCAAFEEGFETPQGAIDADQELLEAIAGSIPVSEDRAADNTVEIQLPLVRHFLPQSRVAAFRSPPSDLADDLGEAIFAAAQELGRRVAVIGSTDLTHYGAAYGFSPKGTGDEALRWVQQVNDRRFIDAVLAMDGKRAVSLALAEHSACSAGAAAAAVAFARRTGSSAGRLLDYRTSLEVIPDASSFVGYAAIVFSPATV